MEYFKYLKSDKWDKKKHLAIKRASGSCQLCNSKTKLNVHHRTYERIFKERPEDLIVLCERCHKLFHNIIPKYKKPILVDIKLKPNPKQKEFDRINKELATCKDENRIKELLRETIYIQTGKS